MRFDGRIKVLVIMCGLSVVLMMLYVPIVISTPCGPTIKMYTWIWDQPFIIDLNPCIDEEGNPAPLTKSIDYHHLGFEMLCIASFILLMSDWIGDEKAGWRSSIASTMSIHAVIFLISSLVQIAMVFYNAKAWGLLPEGPWGISDGNHGPWHRTFLFLDNPVTKLKMGLSTAFILLGMSVATSLSSLILRFNRRKAYLFACCFFALYLAFDQLYWLID